MDRDAFLARLRRAAPSGPLPPPARLAAATELRAGEDLYTRFSAELTAVAGTCERAAATAVPAACVAVLAAHNAKSVAISADTGAFHAPIVAALRIESITACDYADVAADHAALDALDAIITGAVALVAATGSIVTAATAGRAAALIPPLHITVAAADTLVGGLSDALDRCRGVSLVALQSGPSRTADIEKVLILGMHGPGVTHVVVAT
jgi:L-lactate dehydrogenase complex protein LldG